MQKEISHCPNCQDEFGASKVPRIIPTCKHTICENCLIALMQDSSENMLKCPIDNSFMSLEEKSIHSFPKNFSILKSIDKRTSGLLQEKQNTLIKERQGEKIQTDITLREHSRLPNDKEQSIVSDQNYQNGFEQKKKMKKSQQQKKRQSILLMVRNRIQNNIINEDNDRKDTKQQIDHAKKQQNMAAFCQDPKSPKYQKIRKQIRASLNPQLNNIQENQREDKQQQKVRSFSVLDLKQKEYTKQTNLAQENKRQPISSDVIQFKDQIIESQLKRSEPKSSSKSSFGKQDYCLAHDKLLDVICIDDQRLICSACALFGQHKGHAIKSLSDVKKDILNREKNILKLIQDKQNVEKSTNSMFSDASILKLVQVKKQKVLQQIKQHTQNMINKIREEEKKYLLALDKQSEQLIKSLKKQILPIKNMFMDIKDCETKSLQILEELESNSNIQNKIKFLNYQKKPDFVTKIQQSVLRIKQLRKKIEQKNASIIGKLSIKVRTPDFNNMIILFKERTSLEIAYQPILNRVHNPHIMDDSAPEQLLIDLKQKTQLSGVSCHRNDSMDHQNISFLPIQNTVVKTTEDKVETRDRYLGSFVNSVHKAKSKTRLITSVEVIPRNIRSISKISKNSACVSKSKPKLMKFKIPQKYEKIYQNLTLDSLQILDLTFAELGNECILFILQQLQNKRVKIVKLVRNKLSDQVSKSLWKNMKNIQSLNLSQNLFTDKILDSFINNLPHLQNLKSIAFSQNKINIRAVKPQLQEIKKHNVTLSL